MNLSVLKAFFDRLSVRTKLIIVGAVTFFIGMFFGGHGAAQNNGRYVLSGNIVLDTQTGQVYVIDANSDHMKRGPSLPNWLQR